APVFAGQSSGWAFASFGYIVGYLAAGYLVGRLAERGGDRTPLRTAGLMALGNLAIYAAGVPWLRSEEHTSELQSRENLVCHLLLRRIHPHRPALPDALPISRRSSPASPAAGRSPRSATSSATSLPATWSAGWPSAVATGPRCGPRD